MGLVTLLVLFVLSVIFRKKLSLLIHKVRLPKPILYFLTAIPYVIVEEQVNCQPAWCSKVLIPPTLLPVLFFLLLLFIGIKVFHAQTVVMPMIIFSICGMVFESTFGYAHITFQALAATSPAGFVFGLIWAGFTYVFVSFIPLAVLQD